MKRREFQKLLVTAVAGALTCGTLSVSAGEKCKKCNGKKKCKACSGKSAQKNGQLQKSGSKTEMKEKNWCSGPPPVTQPAKAQKTKSSKGQQDKE